MKLKHRGILQHHKTPGNIKSDTIQASGNLTQSLSSLRALVV